MNGNVIDYLKFKKMITPVIIQVLFWLFAAVVVIMGLVALSMRQPIGGIVMIFIGPIVVRIWAEMTLVVFRINDAVQAIAAKKTESTPSA
jgi:hypothetical protein